MNDFDKEMQKRHRQMTKYGFLLILFNIIIGAALFVGALYLIKYLFF
jgi:hypothetical protein